MSGYNKISVISLFEAGILGHKPDTPAEVLRKRYGDCKGMAILLRTLLKAQGF